MTEHVKQKHLLTIDRRKHAWSVSFDLDGISPDGTREDLARNMVANVAVGNRAVRNDFDRISIFNRPIFNATWDSAAQHWVDFVAQGEPGFTFSPTEENREVLYRCKPFWYKVEFEDSYGPTFVSVTDTPLEGYKLAPMFQDGETYEYRPCFELGIGSDGKPHSRAGLTAFETKPQPLMEKVFSYDSNARTETMADWFSDYLLLLVEFATRNLQGILPGNACGELPINVNSTEDYCSFGFYTFQTQKFTEGETYRLSYMINGSKEYRDVELLWISGEENDEFGNWLEFDIEDIDTLIDKASYFDVYRLPVETGLALPYITKASSGVASKEATSPCVWRGKENPWGNISSFICDMLFDMEGKPGIFYPYKLGDIKSFDGTLNSAYTRMYYKTKTKLESYQANIVAFTTAGEEHFLIPADFDDIKTPHYFATRITVLPNNYGDGLRFLRVGGDYTVTTGINHATYEMYDDSNYRPNFGGRLILQEGS